MASHFMQLFCLLAVPASIYSAALSGNQQLNDRSRFQKVSASALNYRKCDGDNGSTYYKSINNADLNGAISDCKTRLGGWPVAIETEQELKAIHEMLSHDADSASNFWTGGNYNVSTGVYSWSSEDPDGQNNIPFGDWINWAPGHPNVSSTDVNIYGVELVYRGAASPMQFKTRSDNESARYICEIKA